MRDKVVERLEGNIWEYEKGIRSNVGLLRDNCYTYATKQTILCGSLHQVNHCLFIYFNLYSI